jgi:hypothetical protein
MIQLFSGLAIFYVFEPWKTSIYSSLKLSLYEFFTTSWINYHGNMNFLLVVICRAAVAYLGFSGSALLLWIVTPAANDEDEVGISGRDAILLGQFWFFVFCFLINSIAFLAVDLGKVRLHLDVLLLVLWQFWLLVCFLFWWVVVTYAFEIKYRGHSVPSWAVVFLLMAFFLFADAVS